MTGLKTALLGTGPLMLTLTFIIAMFTNGFGYVKILKSLKDRNVSDEYNLETYNNNNNDRIRKCVEC